MSWPKGKANPRAFSKSDLDLHLAIFETIREPTRRYTQQEIAEACGVSRGLIWLIEKQAIAKMRRAAARREALQR